MAQWDEVEALPSPSSGPLQRARLKVGMSQRELAERAEVPVTMISAYERDLRQPTLATLLKLRRARASISAFTWPARSARRGTGRPGKRPLRVRVTRSRPPAGRLTHRRAGGCYRRTTPTYSAPLWLAITSSKA
jgi:transcriptional regulator with XRE-family HTH domain